MVLHRDCPVVQDAQQDRRRISTYSGQNIGAGRKERLQAGFRDSLIATTVLALVMTLVMQLTGASFVRMFVREEDVVALGGLALKITSPF